MNARGAPSRPTVVVTMELGPAQRALLLRELADVADVVHLPSVAEADRAGTLRAATVLLARNTDKELRPGEARCVQNASLVQFINSGLDFIRLSAFAAHVPIASNRGAYSAAIAEHAMAMALAAAKRLMPEHAALRQGTFNERTKTRALRGAVCAILGLGGIGTAIAPLARAFGMKVHAASRRAFGEHPASAVVDRLSPLAELDELLPTADVLMICLPLTNTTRGLIGAERLRRMKPDAVLVNVARGEIVDEDALYAHLRAHPEFHACVDAWWVEPSRHGRFELRHPFLELPNFLGSPHSASRVPDSLELALAQATENVRRVLRGEAALNVLSPEEREDVGPGGEPAGTRWPLPCGVPGAVGQENRTARS